jgi:REP element-mobilizing transposase RayT
MPRKPRLDIPGHLYHVIARGNERRPIFYGREDYEDFLLHLRVALAKAGAKCLAWCLMPNHFHLLILRGGDALSGLMRRLMTGYVVGFNLRHRRCGHLFQNRYKAILCDEDEYLIGLIAYIHLNPRRAGLVKSLVELSGYRWCGHATLADGNPLSFLDREYALGYFGKTEKEAVTRYLAFLEECYARQKTGEYSGGGLLKSLGGLENVLSLRKSGSREMADDRVLGGGSFVETVLKEAEQSAAELPSKAEIVERVLKEFRVDFKEILSGSRERRVSEARAAYCYLAKEKCRISGGEISKELMPSPLIRFDPPQPTETDPPA